MISHLQKRRRLFAAITAYLMVLTVGCASFRDATRGPQYRQVKRLTERTSGNLYRINKREPPASIFNTMQAITFWEDESERVRSEQRGWYHMIVRVPAGIVEVAYVIAVSPLLLISYLFALPVWYDTGRDATFGQEPLYWEEYPWYWTTRGLWVIDFILHDIPYTLFAWPARAISGKPYEWEEELELEPF